MFGLMICMALLVPLVTSATSIGPFKQYECVTIPQLCSSCTYNNITSIMYPNHTQALGNTDMVKAGSEYTYEFCSTEESGIYEINGMGNIDGDNEVWHYTMEITPSGYTQKSVWQNPLLIIFSFFAIVFLIFGFYNENAVFVFLASILFLIIGVFTMIYGFNDITNLYTRAVSIVLIGVGIIFMFWSGYEMALGDD